MTYHNGYCNLNKLVIYIFYHSKSLLLGVSEYVDHVELLIVASHTDNVIHVDTFNQLAAQKEHLLNRICGIENGLPPTPPPDSCSDDVILDIAILFDSSGSIEKAGEGNYDLLKEFIIQIIRRLPIGSDYTRVN